MLLLRAPMHKLIALALAAVTLPCSAQLRLDLVPETTLLQQQALEGGAGSSLQGGSGPSLQALETSDRFTECRRRRFDLAWLCNPG